VAEGRGLEDLTAADISQMIPECDDDVVDVLSPGGAIARRTHTGSAGIQSVRQQLAFWDEWITVETRKR
jgi:argininosuccinate lyase